MNKLLDSTIFELILKSVNGVKTDKKQLTSEFVAIHSNNSKNNGFVCQR
jgi:hypothetical protein